MRPVTFFLVLLLAGCGDSPPAAPPALQAYVSAKPLPSPAEQDLLDEAQQALVAQREGYWTRDTAEAFVEDMNGLLATTILSPVVRARIEGELEQVDEWASEH